MIKIDLIKNLLLLSQNKVDIQPLAKNTSYSGDVRCVVPILKNS